ncbi:helix-turn-helix transcriptional regulator [Streptomyces sp. B6B3]|uniref:helix-turn-helix domain-containing protein n=1 Tax=Streptomyces sp. B6B3 TaxID=3153570 RepID=UPI00325D54BB
MSGDEAAEREWDDEAGEVVRTVGKLVKLLRERAGLTQAELGAAIGYGEDQVSSVERARRIPKPEFLDAADQTLGAGGILAALKDDVAQARYPKKVRDLARLEAEAEELGAYASTVIHGLLQTEEYTRALFRVHRPTLDEDTIERNVSARRARQEILTRPPVPFLSFVQEEVTLRRPIGGKEVLREQLGHLLDVARLRHVEIQVMPTSREEHAALGGSILLLEPRTGPRIAYTEVHQFSRVVTDQQNLRILASRYGSVRAQALTPRESLAFIEKVLGET